MDEPRMLSGEELVNRGVTKSFATLPEIGLKDVIPNGSWLEQKQIQAALEARKHLVKAERIEKLGTLSQAEWKDDLKLAEVTKQTGGHWQYFGHNVGKKLYLQCEEALFLMEVNCLQLKHNDVTVSLQKAYSLLLNNGITINQYKVYASLSRLGYKVFRHRDKYTIAQKEKGSVPTTAESPADVQTANVSNDLIVNIPGEEFAEDNSVTNKNVAESATEVETTQGKIIIDNEGTAHLNVEKETNIIETQSIKNPIDNETEIPPVNKTGGFENSNGDIHQESTVNINTLKSNRDENNIPVQSEIKEKPHLETVADSQNSESTNIEEVNENNKNRVYKYEIKIQKLQNRNLRCVRDINKFFEEIPEMANLDFVMINSPEDDCIPKNIYVHESCYALNLDVIRSKNRRSSTNSSCSSSDEEDQSFRRIINISRSEPPQNSNTTRYYPHNSSLRRINHQFRPSFLFWRPRPNFHFANFRFQLRPYFQHQFHPKVNFNIRPNPILQPYPNVNILNSNDNDNTTHPRAPKRPNNAKQFHLQAVINLAHKVKNHILSGNMVLPGNSHIQTIQALHKLLHTYNFKFNARLRLTPQFDLEDESNITETIELDVEEETQSKRPRLDENSFNDNLNKLREIAIKLKNLEDKGVSTSRHRRALSSAIKTFNKSYNADVYLNDNYEMIDRRLITLDSSSDNDCVIKENKKRQKNKQKLRNPFYILKRLSEKQSNESASTSNHKSKSERSKRGPQTMQSSNNTAGPNISSNWLPNDNEFGRIELCRKNGIYTCGTTSEDQLLFDFMKSRPQNYGDWLDAKIAFTKYLKLLSKQYEAESKKVQQTKVVANSSSVRSIINPESCSNNDMPSLLKKLRIIGTDNSVNKECNIKIDFDVYNRDVAKFRKTNPPKPHFRIVCYDGSSRLPVGVDVATLHAKYNDDVPTVFAIVDEGSVSYLQIKPTDLPVCLPTTSQ